jgi:hypothetical protein
MDTTGGYDQRELEETHMKIRITNVKRLAIACITAGTLLGASLSLMGNDRNDKEITYKQVFVMQGDTLWTLVQEHNPSYSGDLRALVHMASRQNGGTAAIQASSHVMVPVLKGGN